MSALMKYEAARSALAECRRIDEVKDIRDKAEAMAAYARQAKDTEMIQWATEIKVRAERRCGEMLTVAEKNTGGNPNLSKHATGSPPTLADIGLTRNESSRYQQLAAMPAEHFETAVATAKETAGQVTTAFMLREAATLKAGKARPRPPKGRAADAMREELRAAKERGISMLQTYARLTLSAVRAQDSFTEEELSLLGELKDAIAAMAAHEEALT